MATTLTTVTPTAVAATAAVSEALVEQLLAARVKIAALAEAFDRDRAQRLLRAQRELAEQVAPILAAAPEPLDLKLVDQFATRSITVADTDERDLRNRERLGQVQQMIRKRIDELKASDQDLLIKVLRRQREKLEAELALHVGREEQLAKEIASIAGEIDDLTGGGGGGYAPGAAKGRGTRKA
jgi:hypothetical protein